MLGLQIDERGTQVALRLRLDVREDRAFLLGLDRTDDLAIYIEQIVNEAAGNRELADGDSASGTDVLRLVVLNNPSCCLKQLVDVVPGALLRILVVLRHPPEASRNG